MSFAADFRHRRAPASISIQSISLPFPGAGSRSFLPKIRSKAHNVLIKLKYGFYMF